MNKKLCKYKGNPTQYPLRVLSSINEDLNVDEWKFADDGTCLHCCDGSPDSGSDTYITTADVKGKKMVTIICNDCGNALPLY
jgi:hypothetical protein